MSETTVGHPNHNSLSQCKRLWNKQRQRAEQVAAIYQAAEGFERIAHRMQFCAGRLHFVQDELGSFRLENAMFCRVRLCPVCQWRRAMAWQARFYDMLPKLEADNPEAHWVFLTLTVRNCPVEALKETLGDMGRAWQRLIKRKEFKPVQGWLRTVEVTCGQDESAHPHYHVLLMVPPSMMAKDYVPHKRWVALWQDCLKARYSPNVDVRKVRKRKTEAEPETMKYAVREVLKYAVKPDDMITSPDWFLELTKQLHRMRFIASGGRLKGVLVGTPTEKPIEGSEGFLMVFDWQVREREYQSLEYAGLEGKS